MYVNFSSNDFHLTVGSPMANTGLPGLVSRITSTGAYLYHNLSVTGSAFSLWRRRIRTVPHQHQLDRIGVIEIEEEMDLVHRTTQGAQMHLSFDSQVCLLRSSS
jgi:hypothetical protein